MSEKLHNITESIHLSELSPGDTLRITTGSDVEPYQYTLTVQEPGTTPLCELVEILPDGNESEPLPVSLQGSGKLTQSQSPVQIQKPKLRPFHGQVTTGEHLVVAEPGDNSGCIHIIGNLGQEIRNIAIIRQ